MTKLSTENNKLWGWGRMHILSCLWFIIIASMHPLFAQEDVDVELNSLDFRRYPLVDLFVTITKQNSDELVTLSDLDNVDFTLLQNGSPVSLASVSSVYELKKRGESELYIAMVFDNSNSMSGRTALLESAATTFIEGLPPEDYVSIIDFGDGDQEKSIDEYEDPVFARSRCDFTNSKNTLQESILTPDFAIKTYMYDALLYALSELNKTNVYGRKIIIFFSDGINNGSRAEIEDVEQYSLQYNIPVYAIDLRTDRNSTLEELSTNSGGKYYRVREPEELLPVYQTLLNLLKSQYRLSYPSPEPIVNRNQFITQLEMRGLFNEYVEKVFDVEGFRIGFYNIVYFESNNQQYPELYYNYLESFPNSKYYDDVQYKLGMYWFQEEKKLQLALGTFNTLLRKKDSKLYYDALERKAEILKLVGDFQGSQDALNQLLNNEYNTNSKPNALLELADSYNADGNFISALNTYNNLTEEYAGTEWEAEGLLQSSLLNMDMGNLEEAEESLNQLVMKFGDSEKGIKGEYTLGVLEQNREQYQKAIQHYDRVIQSDVDRQLTLESHYRTGEVTMALKQYNQAEFHFRTVVEKSTDKEMLQKAGEKLVEVLNLQGKEYEAQIIMNNILNQGFDSLIGEEPIVSGDAFTETQTLSNGTSITYQKGTENESYITTVAPPDVENNNLIIGAVYEITMNTLVQASFPLRNQWITSGIVSPESAGVYKLVNGKFVLVCSQYDGKSSAFVCDIDKSGVYAILKDSPEGQSENVIHFALGKAKIPKEDNHILDLLAEQLLQTSDIMYEIEGHTDATGEDKINIPLSLKRAMAVKNYLVRAGVEEHRLFIRGYGSQFPMMSIAGNTAVEDNRRSEIISLGRKNETVVNNTRDHYIVQLESSENLENLLKAKEQLKQKGYSAYVIADGYSLPVTYRLVMGMYNNYEAAEKIVDNNVDLQYKYRVLILPW